jgi:hypothetical protein
MRKLLLVDYENVKNFDVSKLDEAFHIIVYVGFGQRNSCPNIYRFPGWSHRIEIQCVHGRGENALDFYIACKLGRVLETSPDTECIVLSGDSGYDPLLHHLNENGLKCKRVKNIAKVSSNKFINNYEKHQRKCYQLVHAALLKVPKNSQPKNRRALTNTIFNMLGKKIDMSNVDKSINALIRKGIIKQEGSKMSYND